MLECPQRFAPWVIVRIPIGEGNVTRLCGLLIAAFFTYECAHRTKGESLERQ